MVNADVRNLDTCQENGLAVGGAQRRYMTKFLTFILVSGRIVNLKSRSKEAARMAHKRVKKFIQKAIEHPGALHAALGIPANQTIPAKRLQQAAHEPGKVGAEARFAETLEGLKH
jgi:hypothetical protein